jgi:hypothetical protein
MGELAICAIRTHFSAGAFTPEFIYVRTMCLQLKYLGIFTENTLKLNVIWHCGTENFNCLFCASNTVKRLFIIFQGGGKQKRYIQENDSTEKPLKIIDKNNLMIISTSC